MFETVKQGFLTVIGMTLMTKDKVEEAAREFAESAKLSQERGQELVDEAVARAKRGRAEFESGVERIVTDILQRMHLATRVEIDELQARIVRLEQAAGLTPPAAKPPPAGTEPPTPSI
ncbi:MAG: hypothetical protein IPM18_13385 [Phycisphaerales bacterium]|nr:hypothetical protein [Phycisphaerales bacterium]